MWASTSPAGSSPAAVSPPSLEPPAPAGTLKPSSLKRPSLPVAATPSSSSTAKSQPPVPKRSMTLGWTPHSPELHTHLPSLPQLKMANVGLDVCPGDVNGMNTGDVCVPCWYGQQYGILCNYCNRYLASGG